MGVNMQSALVLSTKIALPSDTAVTTTKLNLSGFGLSTTVEGKDECLWEDRA